MTGNEIRGLRITAGIRTQQEFANKLGVNLRTVIDWELGRVNVSRDTETKIRQICREEKDRSADCEAA